MGFSIYKVILVVLSVIIGVGSTYYFKLKKDNPIEEIAEEVIKKQTGADVDLSPGTPEKKDSKDKK